MQKRTGKAPLDNRSKKIQKAEPPKNFNELVKDKNKNKNKLFEDVEISFQMMIYLETKPLERISGAKE